MSDIIALLCNKFRENSALSQLSGIFTHVPKDTPYPYMTLEKLSSEENFGTQLAHVKLKVWSRYSGNAEISKYESILKNTLENQGWMEGTCLKIDDSETTLLNDGITRILHMDLKILVREE